MRRLIHWTCSDGDSVDESVAVAVVVGSPADSRSHLESEARQAPDGKSGIKI